MVVAPTVSAAGFVDAVAPKDKFRANVELVAVPAVRLPKGDESNTVAVEVPADIAVVEVVGGVAAGVGAMKPLAAQGKIDV